MYTRKQLVTLDTNRTRVTTPCNFYKGDYNSSVLQIVLYENGKPYEIQDNDKFRLYAKVSKRPLPPPPVPPRNCHCVPSVPPIPPYPLPLIHGMEDVIKQDDMSLVVKNPDASNLKKNVVEIYLGKEIMDTSGILEVEVEMYDDSTSDDKKASFAPFLIQILDNIEQIY